MDLDDTLAPPQFLHLGVLDDHRIEQLTVAAHLIEVFPDDSERTDAGQVLRRGIEQHEATIAIGEDHPVHDVAEAGHRAG